MYDGRWLPLPQDHEMGNFKNFDVMKKAISKVSTLNFNRANFRKLSELVTSVLFLESGQFLGITF